MASPVKATLSAKPGGSHPSFSAPGSPNVSPKNTARAEFRIWVTEIITNTFEGVERHGRKSEACQSIGGEEFEARRKQLIGRVLATLEMGGSTITPLFRAIQTHIGLDITVIDQESTCMVSGTQSTQNRRVRVCERVDSQVGDAVEMVLRHDMLSWVRAYYIYVHFHRYAMVAGYGATQHDDKWYEALYRTYLHCERQCFALLSPLRHSKRKREARA